MLTRTASTPRLFFAQWKHDPDNMDDQMPRQVCDVVDIRDAGVQDPRSDQRRDGQPGGPTRGSQ